MRLGALMGCRSFEMTRDTFDAKAPEKAPENLKQTETFLFNKHFQMYLVFLKIKTTKRTKI